MQVNGYIKGLNSPTAVRALGKFGPAAKSALPKLEPLLKEKGEYLQLLAAFTVWQIERDEKKVVPILVEGIKTRGIPGSAIDLLTKMGPSAKTAVPELTTLLKKGPFESTTKIRLADCLWQITKQPEPSLSALASVFEQDPVRNAKELGRSERRENYFYCVECEQAAAVLQSMGAHAKSVLPTIRAAIKRTNDEEVREVLEDLLGKLKEMN